MHSWSLVCFTLFTQSAIGLVWVSVIGHWFDIGARADFAIRSPLIALILTGLGLWAALAHLARPRLAPHALRNFKVSWLSREVLLVQAFGGAVALSIIMWFLNATLWMTLLEAAACLLGAVALFAMTRVYLLKTVPVWNSPATSLEFAGSAMFLGGALGSIILTIGAPIEPGWNPTFIAAGVGVLMGLILKLAAISPALATEQSSRANTWYETTDELIFVGWTLAIRVVLYICGVLLILSATSWPGPKWLWLIFSLIFIGIAEVLGRRRFYLAYRRLGL